MSIEIEHLSKRYDGKPVIDNVSLSIASGELFVLLGPSGSGKSTLLRLIAGLAEVEHGRIKLHGRDLTHVPARERGIGFVFQHYALFQHMTVAGNVEFALRVRKVAAAKRRERCEELLHVVGLSGLSHRYPRQLSGGQQQRVALARALAHEPSVLLLDEPFGALDAKIRMELREALRRIQRELRLTTIFVTHDQDEAFELADRMAVLREARLLEVGKPQELYLRPRSPFVATFLGGANLLVGPSSDRGIRLGAVDLEIASEVLAGRTPRRMQVLFRPEDVEIARDSHGESPRLGLATVEEQAAVGGFERLRLRLPRLAAVRAVAPAVPFGADYFWVDALRPQHEAARLPLSRGDRAWVALRRFHVLAPANLRLLLDSGTTDDAAAAAELGRCLAEQLDAHTSVIENDLALSLDCDGRDVSDLGRETDAAAEGFDVAVLGLAPGRLESRSEWLRHVRHHLLLVREKARIPKRFLICVAPSELAKTQVAFAERFAWQLGAAVTLLSVLPAENGSGEVPTRVSRFMDACTRVLTSRGVVARQNVRRGSVRDEIFAELEEGEHDLLVLGAPLSFEDRGQAPLQDLLEEFLHDPPACPLLVVRQ